MKTVQTVMGAVKPSDLGFTLSHEHFMMVDNAMRFAFPNWVDMPAITEQAIIEARRVMVCGVRTIIDATPINLGRDVTLLRDVAKATGMNIIASTGFYYQEMPWFSPANFEEDHVAEMLASEVENGIQGTDIRPGIIKCATEAPVLTEMNQKFMRMSARLHRRTGLPIMTHANAKDRTGLGQQKIFAKEGVDLSKVIIGHCDDTNETEYIVEILKNGSYVGMDRIGVNKFNPTENRINMLLRLIDMGYGDRLVLSHDCNVFSDCTRVGGNRFIRRGDDPEWNFRIIPEVVLPALRERGVSEETIQDLTVNNIRRFFENI